MRSTTAFCLIVALPACGSDPMGRADVAMPASLSNAFRATDHALNAGDVKAFDAALGSIELELEHMASTHGDAIRAVQMELNVGILAIRESMDLGADVSEPWSVLRDRVREIFPNEASRTERVPDAGPNERAHTDPTRRFTMAVPEELSAQKERQTGATSKITFSDRDTSPTWSLSVARRDIPPGTALTPAFEDYLRQLESQLRATIHETGNGTIDGVPSRWVRFSVDGQNARTTMLQHYLIHDDGLYVLGLGAVGSIVSESKMSRLEDKLKGVLLLSGP